MSRASTSNPTADSAPAAPSWLEEKVYGPRRQRTIRCVIETVDALRADSKKPRISIASVSAKTKELDPRGQGVSKAAILSNPDAWAYYEQHRTWKLRRNQAGTPPDTYPAIKPDRDQARAGQRYMKMNKNHLVQRLLVVEQAYAELRERWLELNDDLLVKTLESPRQ